MAQVSAKSPAFHSIKSLKTITSTQEKIGLPISLFLDEPNRWTR